MKYIMKQRSVNLPRLMMNYMWKAIIKKYSNLSYEMVLTHIFKEYRVFIHEDETKRAIRHTDIYNLAILRRMGFQKVNNVWTRRTEHLEESQLLKNLEMPLKKFQDYPHLSHLKLHSQICSHHHQAQPSQRKN